MNAPILSPAPSPTGAATPASRDETIHEQMVAMNEALVLGSVRQHELTAAAESTNAQLHREISERMPAEKALHRAQAQLMDRAGQLEGLVAERTTALTATKQRLGASLEARQKGREECRLLRLGLVGMWERIDMVGGTLTIESAPGHGTTVRVDIPFTPERAKP